MLALNVSTHRLITDLGNSASLIFTALKDGVADLYRVWDETFQKWVTTNENNSWFLRLERKKDQTINDNIQRNCSGPLVPYSFFPFRERVRTLSSFVERGIAGLGSLTDRSLAGRVTLGKYYERQWSLESKHSGNHGHRRQRGLESLGFRPVSRDY